jgi:solute carrier family 35 (UDP-sugar transporter), member A1/2/3
MKDADDAVMPKCYFGVPLRYFSLCALTFQTTAAVIVTRYSKQYANPDEEQYASTSLVVTTEAVKFFLSIFFIYVFDAPVAIQAALASKDLEAGSPQSLGPVQPSVVNAYDSRFSASKALVYSQNFLNPLDTLKLAVPALLYTLQNNMIYVALANLEATTFQVGYQSKVITTAVLSVIMLNRTLTWKKWSALFILTGGIVATQIKVGGGEGSTSEPATIGNASVGIAAVLFSAFCSAFAGVYFEKILKGSNPSVWMRNAQLAFFSMIVGIITYYITEPPSVRFFQGYNSMVASLILIQAAGGLIIAVVVKYADNILKGFATALSIVLCGMLSSVLMSFQPSILFVVGSVLAICATMLYSL